MDFNDKSVAEIKKYIENKEIYEYPNLLNMLENDKRTTINKLKNNLMKKYNNYLKEGIRINKLKAYEIELDKKGYEVIAGIDEVGRGPLAGPVVSCAVILPKNSEIHNINDSKKLSSKKRQILFERLNKEALSIGIGIIDEKKIDEINIYQSVKLSMLEAVNNLTIKPNILLIDAIKLENIDIEQIAINKGDEKIYSISSASIIAKVTRDNLMEKLHNEYPNYNFISNKGYGTVEHIEAIKKYGPSPVHRISFLKNILKTEGEGY